MASAAAQQARTFDKEPNERTAELAAEVCPQGECEPYKDILTTFRWGQLGKVPKKGEHGVSLSPTGRGVYVFCKHQVTRKTR